MTFGAAARIRLAPFCVVACLCATDCLPQDRINATCQWTGDTVVLAAQGTSVRSAHLREDVRVAQDLGIRYGDAVGGRLNNDANRGGRSACTDRLIAEIMRRHGVSRDELTVAAETRERWIDGVAVFLPMTVFFLIASHQFAKRLVGGDAQGDRRLTTALLLFWTPLAAGVAVALTQIWGVTVEQLRVRNEHISYRAFGLPASQHGWLLWVTSMGLFASVAAAALHRPHKASCSTTDRRMRATE